MSPRSAAAARVYPGSRLGKTKNTWPDQPGDDRVQQRVQLVVAGRTGVDEYRHAIGAARRSGWLGQGVVCTARAWRRDGCARSHFFVSAVIAHRQEARMVVCVGASVVTVLCGANISPTCGPTPCARTSANIQIANNPRRPAPRPGAGRPACRIGRGQAVQQGQQVAGLGRCEAQRLRIQPRVRKDLLDHRTLWIRQIERSSDRTQSPPAGQLSRSRSLGPDVRNGARPISAVQRWLSVTKGGYGQVKL